VLVQNQTFGTVAVVQQEALTFEHHVVTTRFLQPNEERWFESVDDSWASISAGIVLTFNGCGSLPRSLELQNDVTGHQEVRAFGFFYADGRTWYQDTHYLNTYDYANILFASGQQHFKVLRNADERRGTVVTVTILHC
jgi:hypothetical protein